jgi:hypothetical protein
MKRDWSRKRDADHTVSVWCPSCKGTGNQRLRSAGVIPRVKIISCKKCKGFKRIWVRPDTDIHKEGLKVTPGLWNWDGKWKERQGISRR